MTLADKYAARRLLTEILDAEPRCLSKPADYLEDIISEEWATYLCQDCPVIRQCRDYGDVIEHWRALPQSLSAVYGGENPTARAQRRKSTLQVRYATNNRAT